MFAANFVTSDFAPCSCWVRCAVEMSALQHFFVNRLRRSSQPGTAWMNCPISLTRIGIISPIRMSPVTKSEKSTAPVASPRRQPCLWSQFTAGSSANERKSAITRLETSPRSSRRAE